MTTLAAQLDEAFERIRQLEALLGMDEQMPAYLGLTSHQARMLGVILKRPIASHAALAAALSDSRRAEEPSANLIASQICQMRKKLAEPGLSIRARNREGYWMPDEDKARLRALASGGAHYPNRRMTTS